RVRLLVEFVECAAVPQSTFDAEAGAVVIDRDRIGGGGLPLDGGGAGLLCGLREGKGTIGGGFFIGAHLLRDGRRVPPPRRPAGNRDLWHGWFCSLLLRSRDRRAAIPRQLRSHGRSSRNAAHTRWAPRPSTNCRPRRLSASRRAASVASAAIAVGRSPRMVAR